MRNSIKKIISFILIITLLASVSTVTFASTDVEDNYKTNNSTKMGECEKADSIQSKLLESYMPDLTKEVILNNIQQSEKCEGEVTVYHWSGINTYLVDCKEVLEISELNNMVYITYNTFDAKEIILCYDDYSLNNMMLYDEKSDTALLYDKNESFVYTNFRQGNTFTLDENTEKYIDECVAEGDVDAIKKIKNIKVIETEEGIFIEPDEQKSTPSKNNYQLLLEDLKNDFPTKTNELKLTESLYSSALGRNVTVKVNETRNSYARISSNHQDFPVSTIITVITSFMGWSGMSVAVKVLTAIGVTWDANSQIQSAVRLARTAKYSYYSARKGYAYDTTRYNTYVLVEQYTGTGEFSGGSNSSGVFTWIISALPTTENYGYMTIANNTIDKYNWDIALNGTCTTYTP